MKLLIIESPGKQKTIQKYLGADWKVVASLGHIRGLEQNLDFIPRDFEPRYEYLQEKAKAIKELKEAAAASRADAIYLAADKDFEGEQIAYSVCLLLKLDPLTAKRVTFTEITQKAITYAIEHPGIIDMHKVNTQQTRAILDMLLGFTMSPLLWRYVAPSLSAGRCQTPALRLVVEREQHIESFQSTSSWQIRGEWQDVRGVSFSAVMEDALEDEESTLNYLENIYQTPEATLLSKQIRPWSEKSPDPLITSTLQQQASALFHSNPKNTMKIAQRLYEAGHITYMRTDQPVLSEDAVKAAKEWVAEQYGDDFVGGVKGNAKRAKEAPEGKAQEAHEAIRPTHMEQAELPEGEWTTLDRKMYHLIWQRAIQSVMSPAHGEVCTMKFQIKEDEFLWSSSWKRTLFEGWKRAGKVVSIDEEADGSEDQDESKDDWNAMMRMEVGDEVQWKEIQAEPKETKAHGRFTEATLVRELEKFGIGRPSTFASLLSVLQEKGYVEIRDIPPKEVSIKEYSLKPRTWPAQEKVYKKKVGAEKSKLVPTDLGRSVLEFMLKHFQDLFEYRFTAQMEQRLDRVAEGQEPWKHVLRDIWQSYKDRYEDLLSKPSNGMGGSHPKVKEFSGGLKAVQSKKGPLLLIEGDKKEDTVFLGWPHGVSFDAITEEVARAFEHEVTKKKEGSRMGEWKGTPIVKKTGKFGDYLQCGEVRIPFQEGEDIEKTMERLEAKTKGESGVVKQFKEFVIRTGPYGPYIMKTSLKKASFVSLPKGVDAQKLTEKDVDALYKSGLEAKKKWKSDKK